MVDSWRQLGHVNFYTKSKYVITLPFNVLEIVNILEMLEYIYQKEQEDFFVDDEDRLLKGSAGFMTRIIAYVMIVTNLDNVIDQTYSHTKKFIKKYGWGQILPSNKSIDDKRKKLIKYFLYRNKIFAHPSFSSPAGYTQSNSRIINVFAKLLGGVFSRPKTDNISTQVTSLKYFSGSILSFNEKNFSLGNVSMSVGGVDSIALPTIDIATDHEEIRKYFKEWAEIFSEIIEKLKFINQEESLSKGDFEEVMFS
ncbi:MAG: hypothetical protein AAB373_03505 [Patescibacteria group bacterium]